jgi:hypothetical protein
VPVGESVPSDNPGMISKENQQVGTEFNPWRLSVAPMMDWTDSLLSR